MARKRARKRKPSQPDLEALQAETYAAATRWHEDLALELLGVDLGRCLEFPVLQTVNATELETMRGEADG